MELKNYDQTMARQGSYKDIAYIVMASSNLSTLHIPTLTNRIKGRILLSLLKSFNKCLRFSLLTSCVEM